MQRTEIWLINLDPVIGNEISKTRPAVIVNDDLIGTSKDFSFNHRLEETF